MPADPAAARLRATLAGYSLLGVGFALAAVGRFGLEEAKLALGLSPSMLLGFVLTGPLQARLPDTVIRALVLSLFCLSGLWVIGRSI